MLINKQKIRNQTGKLICEAAFRNTRWYIIIKNHDCYTTLQLCPNGELVVTNCTKSE